MSYQVLARKWRPRNFSTLVGQEHVVRALTHALSEQRLHHAYLFTGTRGVGKTTIARILAKSLNCESGISASPCGICSACKEIDAGRFVDLLEVDAATNTRVDEMRQLLENAVYAPTRGRFKVYVIDEVHMLSNSAFNAMLKTLEEPPEHVKFILATTDPQKIPVTVLSRCLQFNLKQMPEVAIVDHLAHVLKAEEVAFEALALSLIAKAANGSMRDALSLLDQAIAHGAGKVVFDSVGAMLGAVHSGHVVDILEALVDGDTATLLRVASDLSIRSLSFASALQELASTLTRLQILQMLPGAFDQDDPEAGRLLGLSQSLSPEFVQLAYQISIQGRQELALAPDEYSGFVMTLLRLNVFRPESVGDILSSVPGSSRPVAKAMAVAREVQSLPVPEKIATSPVVGVRPSLPSSDWREILAALPLGGLARELAQNCELRSLSQDVCVLRLPAKLAHLQMKNSVDRLQQALSEYLGRSMRLTFELGEVVSETPALAASRERQERQDGAIAAIQQDVFVSDMVDMLDAMVIDSSIKPIA